MSTTSGAELTPEERVRLAFTAQSQYMPDVRADIGLLAEGWVTASGFFSDEAAIDAFLRAERGHDRQADLKSAGAFLMGDYAYIVAAATVPLFVGYGIVPDLSPADFALNFYVMEELHEGRVYYAQRAHVRYLSPVITAGDTEHDRLTDRFQEQIERHFYPFVEMLFRKTGLSRSALWRLVADAVAGRFLDAGRHFGSVEAAKALAMDMLKKPASPLNNPQLHYFDLTVLDREQRDFSYTFRARGGCCRFYLVDGGELCPTCVLSDPQERDEQLRQAMRRHLGVV